MSSPNINTTAIEQARIERRRRATPRCTASAREILIEQHAVVGHHHGAQIDRERHHEAEVLAEEKLLARQRLAEQTVDAAPLDLLGDQPDADEHGDEQPEQVERGKTEILDDFEILPRGHLADQIRARRPAACRSRRWSSARDRAPIHDKPPARRVRTALMR